MSSLTLPHNLIEVWKLYGIHPHLQDNVKVEEHAFSFRGSVILCIMKNLNRYYPMALHDRVGSISFCHIR